MLSFHGNLGAAIQYTQLTTLSQGNKYRPILHVLRELILDILLRFRFLREPRNVRSDTRHESRRPHFAR